jgi:hypothetical protein
MKIIIAFALWLALCGIFLSLFRINQYENDDDQPIVDREKSRNPPRSE